jgi:hypothetical protein
MVDEIQHSGAPSGALDNTPERVVTIINAALKQPRESKGRPAEGESESFVDEFSQYPVFDSGMIHDDLIVQGRSDKSGGQMTDSPVGFNITRTEIIFANFAWLPC